MRRHNRILTFLLRAAVLVAAPWEGAALGQEPNAGWSARVPTLERARHYYVSPQGKPDNSGTREASWDLASALAGKQKIMPGDVVWVRGGQYRNADRQLLFGLAGTEQAPIHVRSVPGERVTILDCQVTSSPAAQHTWLWDLELTASQPPVGQSATPSGSVGMFLRWGTGCKFINMVVHDIPGGGVCWWTDAGAGEMHGCLIYGNGRRPDAPKHGHCIYTQNRDGTKIISNCILSVPSGDPYSIYASGTANAYIDNFLIEDNIVLDRGQFLVGGGRASHGIRVLRNHLHGVDMRIGNGPENADCELRDNVLAGGTLILDKFKMVIDQGNVRGLPEQRAVLILNKYDPQRAHLVVYNGAKKANVAVAVAGFLASGDAYRLLDPKNPFGPPLVEGTCDGQAITIPMKEEFGAWVVVKTREKP